MGSSVVAVTVMPLSASNSNCTGGAVAAGERSAGARHNWDRAQPHVHAGPDLRADTRSSLCRTSAGGHRTLQKQMGMGKNTPGTPFLQTFAGPESGAVC